MTNTEKQDRADNIQRRIAAHAAADRARRLAAKIRQQDPQTRLADHAAATQLTGLDWHTALWATSLLPAPARRPAPVTVHVILRDVTGAALGHTAVAR